MNLNLNYYQILGVTFESTEKEIKKNPRKNPKNMTSGGDFCWLHGGLAALVIIIWHLHVLYFFK